MKRLLTTLLVLILALTAIVPGTSAEPGAHTHKWKDLGIITEATCTTSGIGVHVCETCQEDGEYIIPAKGHMYQNSWEIIKDPTCTEPGLKKGVCQREIVTALGKTKCGNEWIVETPATGHSWTGWYHAASVKNGKKDSMRQDCIYCGRYHLVKAEPGDPIDETDLKIYEPDEMPVGIKLQLSAEYEADEKYFERDGLIMDAGSARIAYTVENVGEKDADGFTVYFYIYGQAVQGYASDYEKENNTQACDVYDSKLKAGSSRDGEWYLYELKENEKITNTNSDYKAKLDWANFLGAEILVVAVANDPDTGKPIYSNVVSLYQWWESESDEIDYFTRCILISSVEEVNTQTKEIKMSHFVINANDHSSLDLAYINIVTGRGVVLEFNGGVDPVTEYLGTVNPGSNGTYSSVFTYDDEDVQRGFIEFTISVFVWGGDHVHLTPVGNQVHLVVPLGDTENSEVKLRLDAQAFEGSAESKKNSALVSLELTNTGSLYTDQYSFVLSVPGKDSKPEVLSNSISKVLMPGDTDERMFLVSGGSALLQWTEEDYKRGYVNAVVKAYAVDPYTGETVESNEAPVTLLLPLTDKMEGEIKPSLGADIVALNGGTMIVQINEILTNVGDKYGIGYSFKISRPGGEVLNIYNNFNDSAYVLPGEEVRYNWNFPFTYADYVRGYMDVVATAQIQDPVTHENIPSNEVLLRVDLRQAKPEMNIGLEAAVAKIDTANKKVSIDCTIKNDTDCNGTAYRILVRSAGGEKLYDKDFRTAIPAGTEQNRTVSFDYGADAFKDGDLTVNVSATVYDSDGTTMDSNTVELSIKEPLPLQLGFKNVEVVPSANAFKLTFEVTNTSDKDINGVSVHAWTLSQVPYYGSYDAGNDGVLHAGESVELSAVLCYSSADIKVNGYADLYAYAFTADPVLGEKNTSRQETCRYGFAEEEIADAKASLKLEAWKSDYTDGTVRISYKITNNGPVDVVIDSVSCGTGSNNWNRKIVKGSGDSAALTLAPGASLFSGYGIDTLTFSVTEDEIEQDSMELAVVAYGTTVDFGTAVSSNTYHYSGYLGEAVWNLDKNIVLTLDASCGQIIGENLYVNIVLKNESNVSEDIGLSDLTINIYDVNGDMNKFWPTTNMLFPGKSVSFGSFYAVVTAYELQTAKSKTVLIQAEAHDDELNMYHSEMIPLTFDLDQTEEGEKGGPGGAPRSAGRKDKGEISSHIVLEAEVEWKSIEDRNIGIRYLLDNSTDKAADGYVIEVYTAEGRLLADQSVYGDEKLLPGFSWLSDILVAEYTPEDEQDGILNIEVRAFTFDSESGEKTAVNTVPLAIRLEEAKKSDIIVTLDAELTDLDTEKMTGTVKCVMTNGSDVSGTGYGTGVFTAGDGCLLGKKDAVGEEGTVPARSSVEYTVDFDYSAYLSNNQAVLTDGILDLEICAFTYDPETGEAVAAEVVKFSIDTGNGTVIQPDRVPAGLNAESEAGKKYGLAVTAVKTDEKTVYGEEKADISFTVTNCGNTDLEELRLTVSCEGNADLYGQCRLVGFFPAGAEYKGLIRVSLSIDDADETLVEFLRISATGFSAFPYEPANAIGSNEVMLAYILDETVWTPPENADDVKIEFLMSPEN